MTCPECRVRDDPDAGQGDDQPGDRPRLSRRRHAQCGAECQWQQSRGRHAGRTSSGEVGENRYAKADYRDDQPARAGNGCDVVMQ